MKPIVTAFVLSLFLANSAHANEGGKTPAPPNIVFILADDLGWADIEPYGSKFHETPNLKRLADRSMRFTNFYSASPLCSPTRSSILTGLYPARTGITAPNCHLPQVQLEKRLAAGNANQQALNADSVTRLLTDYPTIARLLASIGYRTAHFGKWHLGHGAGYEPKDHGFHIDIPHTPRAAGPGGGYFAPWKFVTDPKYKGKPGEHIDEWMADRAAEFIQESGDKPFYINFCMYSVHSPWNADKKLIEHFEKKADPKARQQNPLYAAMVKSMDNAVGKLLDALDAAKVADNTIVVFTSDNGGWAYLPTATDPEGYANIPATSNYPLRSGKASNFEGGTRVPCLIAWPGKTRPGPNDALFSSVDFMATLIEMTGAKVAVPKNDGVSQVPTLLGKKGPRDTIFVHFPHGSAAQELKIPGFWPGTSVRKGDWKLIRFYAKNDDLSDRYELYDLKHDISESKNLAKDDREKVHELSEIMNAFLKDTGAVIPRANPNYRKGQAIVAGWSPSKDALLEIRDGNLVVTSTGGDLFVTAGEIPAGMGPYKVEIKMKSDSKGMGQVFWSTKGDKGFHRDRSITFDVTHDGKWRHTTSSCHRNVLWYPCESIPAPRQVRSTLNRFGCWTATARRSSHGRLMARKGKPDSRRLFFQSLYWVFYFLPRVSDEPTQCWNCDAVCRAFAPGADASEVAGDAR